MKARLILTASLFAATLASPCVVMAEEGFKVDIKPGTWRHSFTMKSETGQMEQAIEEAQRQLQQLPESQRRMVEEMMARQGIDLNLIGSSIEVCITEEDLRNGALPQQDGCEQTLEQQGDNNFVFEFQCVGDPPYSGSGMLTRVNQEHYTGTAEFETRMGGQSERITMNQEGRWLRDSCSE